MVCNTCGGRLGSSERWLPYSDHHRQFPHYSLHVPYTPVSDALTPHSSPHTNTPTHLKHLQQLLPAHLQPHKRLFLFDNAPEERVELVKVCGGDLPSLQERVVVVSVLNWRSIAEDTSTRYDGGGSNCAHVIMYSHMCASTQTQAHTHTREKLTD